MIKTPSSHISTAKEMLSIKKSVLHIGLENIFAKLNFILYWKSCCEQIFKVEEITKDNQ